MRALKLAISLGYWLLCLASGSLKQAFGLSSPTRRVVLYYHSITEAQRPRFRWQMQLLQSRTKVVPLAEIASSSGSKWQTCITFDDGLDNVRRNAVPILLELGFPASIFVVSGNLGRRPEWKIEPGHPDAAARLMTAEQLVNLPRHAIEIGSHTASHPNLAELPPREARRELHQSKRHLEQLLGRPVSTLSLPFGEYNDETLQIARSLGYEAVLTCEPEIIPRDSNAFAIGRFKVTPDDWTLEFWLKAKGAYAWRRHARRLKRACVSQRRRPGAAGKPRCPDAKGETTADTDWRELSRKDTAASESHR